VHQCEIESKLVAFEPTRAQWSSVTMLTAETPLFTIGSYASKLAFLQVLFTIVTVPFR
jgi:hypothetical protein